MAIVTDTLRRFAWGIASLLYATTLLSLFRLPHVPVWIACTFALLAAACAIRPVLGLVAVAALAPSASYFLRWFAADPVVWAEALVIAASAGWCARRAVSPSRDRSLAAAASLAMAAVVLSAIVSALALRHVAMGPDAWALFGRLLTAQYFVDIRSIPGLRAGVLLLEAMTLFAYARWVISNDRTALRRVATAAVFGAALAAAVNVGVLVRSAMVHVPFWGTLVGNLTYVRYNAHYADVNAAGSFFVLCLVTGLAAAAAFPAGWRRSGVALLAVCAAAGLWTSGSRTAMVAGALAGGAALVLRLVTARGRQMRMAVAIAMTALAIAAAAGYYMPIRSSQHSASIAVDVRVELAAAAARMIAVHPLLGVGVGQFPERVGEFVSPRLLAIFPPAAHENAHNYFIQIAAELGLFGMAAFVLLLGAALHDAVRGSSGDALRTGLCIALGAFTITCVGGHPLLVPEASYTFWVLLGAASAAGVPRSGRVTAGLRAIAAAIAVIAIVSTPVRGRALVADTDFEHMAIGVSPWQTSPDDRRYREATDVATLFVPASEPFAVDVQAVTGTPVRIELRLDGRIADVVTLAPGTWQQLTLPARTERMLAKYSRLELRVIDRAPGTVFWTGKVRPLGPSR